MVVHHLSVQGYRSIQSITLNPERINVVVGANGSGKSNLYKAVSLLAHAAHGRMAETLALEGGMPSVLWAGNKKQGTHKKPVRFSVSLKIDDLNYELVCGLPSSSLSMFALDPEVKSEHVWWGESRRPSTTILERKGASVWVMDQYGQRVAYPLSVSQSESVLSQLKEPHLYPELFALNQEMQKWRFYHHFRTDPDSPIRHPQIGTRSEVLSNEGGNLAAAFQTIIEMGDHDVLQEAVARAFPDSKLIINVDNRKRFSIQLQVPGMLRPLEASELSDGTLRYLCWMAALLSPRPAALMALNEPEASLHPDLMQPLAELVVRGAEKSQLWITTHSCDLAEKIKALSGNTPLHLVRSASGTQIKDASPGHLG